MKKRKLIVFALTSIIAVLSFFTGFHYEDISVKQAQIEVFALEKTPANEKDSFSLTAETLIINQVFNTKFTENKDLRDLTGSRLFVAEKITKLKGSNLSINPSEIVVEPTKNPTNITIDEEPCSVEKIPLIYDSTKVNYKSYLPEMVYSSEIEAALEITNPEIKIVASSAILFNANTGEVLYYKNPVSPVFPASTSKLLTALVALDWCEEDEEITVGDEIKMIAYDSSKAHLKSGQILTVANVLEAMLLPSGNDAAYVMAAFVGKKSLENPEASKEQAINRFVVLMNLKAKALGVVNSYFMTPDGYDAIGQHTTAYDMGMIGLEAVKSETILRVTQKSTAKNTFISGEKYTWNSTNALIKKESSWYYANAIGLKTGTTTMAGRCLVSAARKNEEVVVCVVLHSTSEGRWSDSTKLLKYGLQ